MLLGHKKEQNLAIYNSMDGPGRYYTSEISQSETDKEQMISLRCGI